MSVITTKVGFSRVPKTASYEILIDGVAATTYTLAADGMVSISALSHVFIPVAGPGGWFEFLRDARAFIKKIDREVAPAPTPLTPCMVKEETTATGITLRVEQGPFVLTRAEYVIATGEIEFKARGATSMPWLGLDRWYEALEQVAADIARIA